MFDKLKQLIAGKPSRPDFLDHVYVFLESSGPTVRLTPDLPPEELKAALEASVEAADKANKLYFEIVDGRPQVNVFSSQEATKPFFEKLYQEKREEYGSAIVTGFVTVRMKPEVLFPLVLDIEDLRVVLDPETPNEKIVPHKTWRVIGEMARDTGSL